MQNVRHGSQLIKGVPKLERSSKEPPWAMSQSAKLGHGRSKPSGWERSSRGWGHYRGEGFSRRKESMVAGMVLLTEP